MSRITFSSAGVAWVLEVRHQNGAPARAVLDIASHDIDGERLSLALPDGAEKVFRALLGKRVQLTIQIDEEP